MRLTGQGAQSLAIASPEGSSDLMVPAGLERVFVVPDRTSRLDVNFFIFNGGAPDMLAGDPVKPLRLMIAQLPA